ncbi:hypothetical protein DFQ27_009148 [Actinomortierella ambigua]|uniref:F-box domain-containing protein n=1 Tax=Actinomortierella ambigua TaxID=1343610 RepID=A0A9P6UA16_9FUNG|nr:hypothetical protein DFQ27_009148 [Actinomortierella ambigua]
MPFFVVLGSLRRGRTLKKPPGQTAQSLFQSPLHPPLSPQQHRALDIPEIVEAILSYVVAIPLLSISDVIQVGRDDRRALKNRQALRVCKLWYTIGCQLLAHNLEWSNTKPVDAEWMEELTCYRRLVCHFETTTYTDKGSNKVILEENWNVLSRRLQEILADSTSHGLCQEVSPRRRYGKFANELCIRGHFKFQNHLASLLSMPRLCQSITMLDLHFNNFDVIDPTLFFYGTLSNTTTVPIMPLPNLRHLYLHKVFIVGIDRHWKLLEPSNLCSLSLENVRVQRLQLLNLLNNLCGPKLMHLRLKSIFIPDTTPILHHGSYMGGIPFRTVTNLTMKCPHLESLEVDRSTTVQMMEGAWMLTTGFPKAQVLRIDNWNFYYRWITHSAASTATTAKTTHTTTTHHPSSFSSSISSAPTFSSSSSSSSSPNKAANTVEKAKERVLTRLEIQGPDTISSTKCAVQEFREFMHDPIKCQHLLELTALHVDIRVDLLTQHIPWQCRHLQVLHLGFSAPTPTSTATTPQSDARANSEAKATSRRIFGFITTTFPNLRHLVLRGPVSISETIGGFCFLSRLQSLETVTLRASTVSLWGNGKLKKTPMIPTGMEEPRWMLSDVKVMDKMRKSGSLRQCRALAELDPFDGFFGTVDGKEMLWPSSNSNSGSNDIITEKEGEEDNVEDAHNTNRRVQGRPVEPLPIEGCCWDRMQSIRLELTDVSLLDQAPISTSLEMMRGLRPDIHFSACHVSP